MGGAYPVSTSIVIQNTNGDVLQIIHGRRLGDLSKVAPGVLSAQEKG